MIPTGEWREFVGWALAVGALLALVFSPMVWWGRLMARRRRKDLV